MSAVTGINFSMTSTYLALALAVLAVVFVALFLASFLHRSKRHRLRRRRPTIPATLRRFSFLSLRSATQHFDPSRSLGRGSSASVFLGILADGKSVAIKRLNPSFPDGHFYNELKVLDHLPHSPFIVSLLGYCHSPPHFLLIYEYMSNGSLQQALFFGSQVLDWDRRFRIIVDVAQALAFLHLQCDPPVIHGDVKPANVLLGADFHAKLADFGLSRRKNETKGDLLIPCVRQDELGFEEKFCELDEGGRIGWWCKQNGSEEIVCSDRDYVREWIGNQIFPSKNTDWDDDTKRSSDPELIRRSSTAQVEAFEPKSLDDDDTIFREGIGVQSHDEKLATDVEEARYDKERKMREWWREEYFDEVSKKGKGLKWFRNNKLGEMDMSFRKGWKKRKNQSTGSEILSSDLYSKELSSTTSMRGTFCYVAPEYGSCSHSYEKADVYSFGVLILVIVSGRRPLHVQESPMKLDRANLISWCRQLALVGDVLDILDEKLTDSCSKKDQVYLCINLALLCLQRTPELRPDSGDIVKILKGEMEIPAVPLESSNSPISRSMRRTK